MNLHVPLYFRVPRTQIFNALNKELRVMFDKDDIKEYFYSKDTYKRYSAVLNSLVAVRL